VFSARADGTTAFWDVRSERSRGQAHLLRAHKGPVTCVLALDQREGSEVGQPLVMTGSADSTIKVWDPLKVKEPGRAKDAPCIQTLAGHGGTVTSLARVGDYVFSSSTDRKILQWRAAVGREAVLYPWFELVKTLAVMDGWVNSIHFNVTHKVGDLGALYAADSTGAVAKFKPKVADGQAPGDRRFMDFTPVTITDRPGASSPPPLQFRRLVSGRGLSHVRYLADDGLVLTLAYDNKMRVYDEKTAQLKTVLDNPHECLFADVALVPSHSQVLLIDKFGFLFVYDVGKEGLVMCHRVYTQPLLAICYNESLDEAGIVLRDTVQWWRFGRDVSYDVVENGHEDPVFAIQHVPAHNPEQDDQNKGFVFSCSLDNTVRVWDPYDMKCLRVLHEDRSELSAMCYCESKGMLVTGHDSGHVRLWNLDTGSTINMKHHTNTVSCIITARLKKGEDFVISGGFDGRVGIWDVRKRHSMRPHLVSMFEAHSQSEVLCLIHDRYKGTLITSGNEGVIKVWSAVTFELVGQHSGHTEAVVTLALDANFLFSGSDDCTIRVWDSLGKPAPNTYNKRNIRTHIKTLEGHTRPVTGVHMLDETGHLLSISLDGTLRVWDYTKGAILKMFEHSEEMRCLAYRFDSNEVLVGTTDNNILVYPLPDITRQSERSSIAPSVSVEDCEHELEEVSNDLQLEGLAVNDQLEGITNTNVRSSSASRSVLSHQSVEIH